MAGFLYAALLNFPKRFVNFFVGRLLAKFVLLRKNDLAPLINDENRAVIESRQRFRFSEHAVLSRDLAVGPEVTAKRVTQHSDVVLLPCDVTVG